MPTYFIGKRSSLQQRVQYWLEIPNLGPIVDDIYVCIFRSLVYKRREPCSGVRTDSSPTSSAMKARSGKFLSLRLGKKNHRFLIEVFGFRFA